MWLHRHTPVSTKYSSQTQTKAVTVRAVIKSLTVSTTISLKIAHGLASVSVTAPGVFTFRVQDRDKNKRGLETCPKVSWLQHSTSTTSSVQLQLVSSFNLSTVTEPWPTTGSSAHHTPTGDRDTLNGTFTHSCIQTASEKLETWTFTFTFSLPKENSHRTKEQGW